MMGRSFLLRIFTTCALLWTLTPGIAHARRPYLEFGFGGTQINGAGAFFGDRATEETLGIGLAFDFAAMMEFSDIHKKDPWFIPHFGIQNKLSTGNIDYATDFGVTAIYALARIQRKNVWIGA